MHVGYKYHPISSHFWADEKVIAWDDDAKLLALYLLTCPHRTAEGLFRLSKDYILADLGWTAQRLKKPFARLQKDGFMKYDETYLVMLLPNALRYQPPKNPNQARAAVNAINQLPPTVLLVDFVLLAQQFSERLAQQLRKELAPGLQQLLRQQLPQWFAQSPSPSPTPINNNPPLPPLNPPEGDVTRQTQPSSQDDPVDDLVRKIGGYLHGYTKSPFGPTMKDEMTIRGWVAEGATLDMFPEVFKCGLEAFQRKRGNGMVPDHAAWYSPFVAKELERKRSHQHREPPKYPDLDEILGDD